jgi:hypothetical protein
MAKKKVEDEELVVTEEALSPEQLTLQSDLRDAAAAMTRAQTELVLHNNLVGTVDFPSTFWSDMNIYRGIMGKYGRL